MKFLGSDLGNNFTSVNYLLNNIRTFILILNKISVKLHNFIFSDNLVSENVILGFGYSLAPPCEARKGARKGASQRST